MSAHRIRRFALSASSKTTNGPRLDGCNSSLSFSPGSFVAPPQGQTSADIYRIAREQALFALRQRKRSQFVNFN